MAGAHRRVEAGGEIEAIVAEAFRKGGWKVRRHLKADDMQADLVVDDGLRKYVVEVKSAPEGRRDRLIPLLSQAILQARSFARHFPEHAAPLAVVGAKRVGAAVNEQLKLFAKRHAPGVAVGVIDADGLRSFVGPGLEGLNAKPSRRATAPIVSHHPPDLFSDLNQWMLKILLGQKLPESLISVPREPIRNASHLAASANVSVMSASRFVNRLVKEGFLDEGTEHLQIVRADELLERWVSANWGMARDIPARMILKADHDQLFENLVDYVARPQAAKSKSRRNSAGIPSRCCLGLYWAANAHRAAFVSEPQPHIYFERIDSEILQVLGLSLEESGRQTDVYIRVPSHKEAVFRACVLKDDFPVSDILQVWLDVSAHPARGREQAHEIRRRFLSPLFGKRR
jgi:hypothetical protein